MKTLSLPISAFCKTGSGTTPSRNKYDRYFSGDIPWVKSGELRESVITNTEETVTQEALAETSLKIAPKGAILVAMYGANVGRLGILGIEATTNQAVCHIVPDSNKADSKYLFRILQQKLPEFISRSVGGAQPNISQQIIRETEIPLPPIAEQKRIAAILDKADELRGLRRRALEQLDAIAQSTFLEMFGDVSKATRFPTQPLETLLEKSLQNGAYFPKESYVETEGIEMVHMSDAFYDVIVRGNLKKVACSDEECEKYSLTKDDLLIARRSLNYEGAAKPCLIPPSNQPLIFESSFIRVTPNRMKITALFLFHYFNNERVKQKYIRPFVTQSTISGINQSNLARVSVITPPLTLQQEFARRIEAIEQLKATHRESLAQLDALFATLQHRAFRGEL